MNIYRGIDDKISRRPRALAVGVFDGVHRGHQKILKKMLREAKDLGAEPTVVTFDPHPSAVLRPRSKDAELSSLAHRLRIFEKMGIASALVIHFNKKTASVTRDRFLNEILLQKLNMKSLTVGHDFCFGRGGEGNVSYLRQQSKKMGFRLSVINPLRFGREVISSTRIRQLVSRGKFYRAKKMLGRPISVYGTVVRGRGRGKSIGYPTANLNPHHETLPPAGVYAAYGFLGNKKLKGVLHIGKRPTFHDRQNSLEVHFLNFHNNIYGRDLELIFLARLRPITKFEDAQSLKRAIARDVQKALFFFTRAVKTSIL